jgi:hypothetical protein
MTVRRAVASAPDGSAFDRGAQSGPASFLVWTATQTCLPVVGCFSSKWMLLLYPFPKPGDAGKSIVIMNVHPSASVNPAGFTITDPFARGALYELKVDTKGDAVADIAARVRFSASEAVTLTATVRPVEGVQAAGTDHGGQAIIEGAPVSIGREARHTHAGDYRSFAGWRSDPFFLDTQGALNQLQFTVDDFFADKDVSA